MKAIYMKRGFCCCCCSFQTEVIVLNTLCTMIIGYVMYGMIAQTFFTKKNLIDAYVDEQIDLLKQDAHDIVDSLIIFYWVVMITGIMGLLTISLNLFVFLPNDKLLKSERRIYLIPWIIWCLIWMILIIALYVWITHNINIIFLRTLEATVAQCIAMLWSIIAGTSYYHSLKYYEQANKGIKKSNQFHNTIAKLKENDSSNKPTVYNSRNNLLTPQKHDGKGFKENPVYTPGKQNGGPYVPLNQNGIYLIQDGKAEYVESPYPPLRQNKLPYMTNLKPFIVDGKSQYEYTTQGYQDDDYNKLPLNRSYSWAGAYVEDATSHDDLSKSMPAKHLRDNKQYGGDKRILVRTTTTENIKNIDKPDDKNLLKNSSGDKIKVGDKSPIKTSSSKENINVVANSSDKKQLYSTNSRDSIKVITNTGDEVATMEDILVAM